MEHSWPRPAASLWQPPTRCCHAEQGQTSKLKANLEIKGGEALCVLGQSRTHPGPGKVPEIRLLVPPSEPPSNAEATGEVGEGCLSPRKLQQFAEKATARSDCGVACSLTPRLPALVCLVARCAVPCTRAARYAFFNKLLSHGRVPQPPVVSSHAGHPEGAGQWGGLLWPTFLGRAKKTQFQFRLTWLQPGYV